MNYAAAQIGPIIDRQIETFAKKGEPILAPMGNPVIYPKGSFKNKCVKEDVFQQGKKMFVASVDAELTISEKTTHRFLIETMNVQQQDGKMQQCSWTSTVGVTQTKNTNIGTGLVKPGRHEVLHILIARPLLGTAPAVILDVAKSVVDVPQP